MSADYLLYVPMMASGFAPLLLNPVGYAINELRRLLIDFRFRPSPRGAYCWLRVPAITLGIYRSLVKQISPGKNMNFACSGRINVTVGLILY
jgi:hypothetical protein